MTLTVALATCAIGQEFPVSDVTYSASQFGYQSPPAIASAGGQFLGTAGRYLGYSFRAFGALLEIDGRSLQAMQMLEFPGAFGDRPAVATDGRDYLVVSGALGGTQAWRVDASGHLIDAVPFPLHATTRGMTGPHDYGDTNRAVAWDGSRYVVISTAEFLNYNPFSYQTQGIVSIVGPDGSLEQTTSIPDIGSAGQIAARNGISVIASASGSVIARTLNSANVFGKLQRFGPGAFVNVAAGDDGFLLVWNDSAAKDKSGALHAEHLDSSGAPDKPVFDVGASALGQPAVVWVGDKYLISWTAADGIDARYVSSISVAGDPFAVAGATTAIDAPALAWNGRSVIAAYRDIEVAWSGERVMARVIDGQNVSTEVAWEVTATPQYLPQAARGSVFGVAWQEQDGVRFGRVTPGGALLDGPGILLDGPGILGVGGTPLSVACIGGTCLTVWGSDGGILAARVDDQGTVLDQPPLHLGDDGSSAKALTDGRDFFVIWSSGTPPSSSLRAGRIAPAGVNPVQKQSLISDSFATAIDGAWNGKEFLVAFVGNGGPVLGMTMTPDLSAAPLASAIADASENPTSISVASNGVDFLAVWPSINIADAAAPAAIRARGVSAAGESGDANTVAFTKLGGIPFAVGGVGNYRIVWGSPGNNATVLAQVVTDSVGKRLSPVQLVSTIAGAFVAAQPVADPRGSALATVYTRAIGGSGFGPTPRVFLSVFGSRRRTVQ